MAGKIWKITQKGRADREFTLPLEASLKKGDFVKGLGVVVEIDDTLGNLSIATKSGQRRRCKNIKETGNNGN